MKTNICVHLRMVLLIFAVFALAAPASGEEPLTVEDVGEAFLIWSQSGSQFSGQPKRDAKAILHENPDSTGQAAARFFPTPLGFMREQIIVLAEDIGPAIGPEMRKHIGEDSPFIGVALLAIAKSGDSASLPAVARHLSSPKARVRAVAAMAVGYLEANPVPDTMAGLLAGDEDRSVRKSAAWAYGVSRNKQYVGPLIAALEDPYFGARFNAARGLAKIDTDAVRAVTAAYDQMSDTAKYGALTALGRMSNDRSAAFLRKIALDERAPDRLRGAALKGLLERGETFTEPEKERMRSVRVLKGLLGKALW